jgi:hypothetical protein
MAASGYTPIQLYYSTTAATAPLAANLLSGELAINILDEKLYFKNSAGTVKVIANSANTGTVTSVAQSFTGGLISVGGSPITTSGTLALTVAGTSGGIPYFSGASTWASSAALTANAIVLGGGAGAAPTVLASTGTTTTVLHGNAAGAPTFGAVSLTADVSGTLPIGNGGTNITTYTTGDLLYSSTTNVLSKLGIGTTGQILTVSGGVPTWSTPAAGGVTTISFGTTGLTPSTATSGAVTVAGTLAVANGGTGVTTSTGSGSVVLSTSPALTTPNLGTPSAINLTNATAVPMAQASGTLGVANGGTGSTSLTANYVMLGNGTSALSSNMVAPSTSGNLLTSNGTTWTSAAAAFVTKFQAAVNGSYDRGYQTWYNYQGTAVGGCPTICNCNC